MHPRPHFPSNPAGWSIQVPDRPPSPSPPGSPVRSEAGTIGEVLAGGAAVAVALAALLLLVPARAGAEGSPAGPRGGLRIGGYIDLYLARNGNRPADGLSFFPGTGSTAREADEPALNLAAIDLSMTPDPVGFQLVLNAGRATDIVHAVEFGGLGVDLDDYRLFQTAKVIYPASPRWTLEAGKMPSHVGFEVFPSKDDWNYTRSWMAELSPYYQTGIAAKYTGPRGWSGQVLLLTGWQLVEDNNGHPTLGTQLAWSRGDLGLSWNTLRGPELPGDDRSDRTFHDFVVTWKRSDRLQLAATYDLAHQEIPGGPDDDWHAGAAYLRWQPTRKLALALRVERFADPDAGISGFSQTLRERTLTFEYRPQDDLILKLDLRRDTSDSLVFEAGVPTGGGGPAMVRDQDLVVLGVVAKL